MPELTTYTKEELADMVQVCAALQALGAGWRGVKVAQLADRSRVPADRTASAVAHLIAGGFMAFHTGYSEHKPETLYTIRA